MELPDGLETSSEAYKTPASPSMLRKHKQYPVINSGQLYGTGLSIVFKLERLERIELYSLWLGRPRTRLELNRKIWWSSSVMLRVIVIANHKPSLSSNPIHLVLRENIEIST